MTLNYVFVVDAGEVPEGEARVFDLGEASVAICQVNGEIHAVEDLCTHDDGPLGEGSLHGCELECPRHGARFDVRTGAATRMPAAAPVRVFPVKVEDGRIYVAVESE